MVVRATSKFVGVVQAPDTAVSCVSGSSETRCIRGKLQSETRKVAMR